MKTPVSFRRSLLQHFIVVAALPILLLGVFSFQYFKHKHLETVFGLLNAHALDVSYESSEFLEYNSRSLALIKRSLRSVPQQNDAEINSYLQAALVDLKDFESIFIVNHDYRVTHLGLSSEKTRRHREDFLALDFSSHQLFADGTQISGPTWSDTFLSAFTAEPSIVLALPFERGALLGTISLKKLSVALVERLQRSGLKYQFSLLDHRGALIADSRPGLVEQRLNLRFHPEIRDAIDNKVEVTAKLHEDNLTLESVHLVPETGWVAYVSLPIAEALADIAPLKYLFLSAFTFAGCLGVGLSLWLSRRLLKPLLLLRDAVKEFANGQYEQELQSAPYEELEDLSGSFREMMGAVQERERSIRKSQSRYRNLVDSIDGIVWEFDTSNQGFTFVSDRAERMLGYPPQHWIDDREFWLKHVCEEDRAFLSVFDAEHAHAQGDYEFEYRMRAADGRIVWLRNIVSVVKDERLPVRLSGVMLDITPRKKAEMYLQESSEQLQLLVDRMPIGCITLDVEKKIELWNPAAERIFGFSAQEVVGLHPNEFLIPEHVTPEVETVFARLEAGDLLAHNINENLTKDGRTLMCEWHNTPLQNPEGVTERIICMVQDISQRAAAESALKESETRFRKIFEIHPDAVLINRLSDGKIISVNDHCLSASGYAPHEMLGKTSLELGLWEDPAQRDEYLALMNKDGHVDNFEMDLRIKSGRIRTGLASAILLSVGDEECAMVVIRDVTEMKDAERRMVRSEERFRSLVSAMGEGLIILGHTGEIVHCNQTAERVLQRNAEDLTGLLHNELFQGSVREDGKPLSIDESPTTKTLKTGRSVTNLVLGLPRTGGDFTWMQVNTNALGLDKSGKPVAVVISFADVSALKQTQNELRESEKHLQALSRQFEGVLEAIPDRILILDRDMRVIWLNWSEEPFTDEEGLASQDVRCYQLPGVNCGPTADKNSFLCDECPVKKTFVSGETESVQKNMPDGRTLSLRTFPVRNDQGDVVNVIEIAQDITASLRQQGQAMRAGQLAALGELAAGVAHEINNPINGVINYAQLILNKAVDDSREGELSRRIIKESERIATIVRELLYFSREESQEIELITVMHAIDEALALIKRQLFKDGIDLQLEFRDDLPKVKSASHQIPRLFLNLISNARHALNEKYPGASPDKILQIRGGLQQEDNGLFVHVSVKDFGAGIPADLLDRVMNPFVTTKSSAEGTGLGLSITHEIVQKHGGTLSIDSVHGEYTEVIVQLPAMK